jgi:hypothetical protein
MSWFNVIGVFCLLALTSCGFTPMYKAADTRQALNSLRIANIPDAEGQYLKNALIDRLPQSGEARYEMRMSPLFITIDNRAIRKDATSTRGEMRITTRMDIVDLFSGKTLSSQQLETAGGFNQLDNRFATLTSREDLTRRLLNELADNARLAFALTLQEKAPAP